MGWLRWYSKKGFLIDFIICTFDHKPSDPPGLFLRDFWANHFIGHLNTLLMSRSTSRRCRLWFLTCDCLLISRDMLFTRHTDGGNRGLYISSGRPALLTVRKCDCAWVIVFLFCVYPYAYSPYGIRPARYGICLINTDVYLGRRRPLAHIETSIWEWFTDKEERRRLWVSKQALKRFIYNSWRWWLIVVFCLFRGQKSRQNQRGSVWW